VLRGLDQRTSVSRLVNTMLDARDLVEAVMLDFGLDPGHGHSKPHLLRDLARFLVDQRTAGRLALLVIDEAQNLSTTALEEVRMLSNLETEKSKLIQIVLVGQPNLRDVLAGRELEQLRQRVTVSYHLQALDAAETAAYIGHRLRRAALGAPLELSREVTDLIHFHSEGLPRKINVIADAVLLFGYGEEKHVITADLTREVVEELHATGVILPVQQSSAPQTIREPEPDLRSLDVREAQLAERERQLAERQRILAEEYRLLQLRSHPTSQRMADTAASWPPPRVQAAAGRQGTAATLSPPPRQAIRRAAAVTAALAHGQPTRGAAAESVWSRLRRGLTGVPKPIFED
jgi:type II secretory pathway predicted ATPase ExeA